MYKSAPYCPWDGQPSTNFGVSIGRDRQRDGRTDRQRHQRSFIMPLLYWGGCIIIRQFIRRRNVSKSLPVERLLNVWDWGTKPQLFTQLPPNNTLGGRSSQSLWPRHTDPSSLLTIQILRIIPRSRAGSHVYRQTYSARVVALTQLTVVVVICEAVRTEYLAVLYRAVNDYIATRWSLINHVMKLVSIYFASYFNEWVSVSGVQIIQCKMHIVLMISYK